MPMFRPPSPPPLFGTENEFRAWMDEQDRRYKRSRTKAFILIALCFAGLAACFTQVEITDMRTTVIEDQEGK